MAQGPHLEKSVLIRRAIARDLDWVAICSSDPIAVSSSRRVCPSRDTKVRNERGVDVATDGARKRGAKSRSKQSKGKELHVELSRRSSGSTKLSYKG